MAHDFQTTLWSRIAAAQRRDSIATEDFVARYRPPLLRFVASWGFSKEDAEDLAQEILIRLFEKGSLERADKARGRFRHYLLEIARNVMRDELTRRNAQKRGGGKVPVSLSELGEPAAPGDEFQKRFEGIWLEHLLKEALGRLAEEHAGQHQALELRFLRGLSYDKIAETLGRNSQQVRNDLHRARKRVVRILKDTLAENTSSQEEYEDELATLRGFLGEKDA